MKFCLSWSGYNSRVFSSKICLSWTLSAGMVVCLWGAFAHSVSVSGGSQAKCACPRGTFQEELSVSGAGFMGKSVCPEVEQQRA